MACCLSLTKGYSVYRSLMRGRELDQKFKKVNISWVILSNSRRDLVSKHLDFFVNRWDNSEVCSSHTRRQSLEWWAHSGKSAHYSPFIAFLSFPSYFPHSASWDHLKNTVLGHKSLQQSSALGETQLKHLDSSRMPSFSSTSISRIVLLLHLCTHSSLPSFPHLLCLPFRLSQAVLSFWFLWEI